MTTAALVSSPDLGGVIDRLTQALRDDSGTERSVGNAEGSTKPMSSASAHVGERHVGVSIAGESFAIPMASVIEIQRLPSLTPLPGIADWLLGVTNFHGDVLSVVDPRSMLGLGEAAGSDRSRRLMVLQSTSGSLHTGLLVDATLGVRSLDPASIRPTEGELAARLSRYLRGTCEFDDRLVSVLDVERLLDDLSLAVEAG